MKCDPTRKTCEPDARKATQGEDGAPSKLAMPAPIFGITMAVAKADDDGVDRVIDTHANITPP